MEPWTRGPSFGNVVACCGEAKLLNIQRLKQVNFLSSILIIWKLYLIVRFFSLQFCVHLFELTHSFAFYSSFWVCDRCGLVCGEEHTWLCTPPHDWLALLLFSQKSWSQESFIFMNLLLHNYLYMPVTRYWDQLSSDSLITRNENMPKGWICINCFLWFFSFSKRLICMLLSSTSTVLNVKEETLSRMLLL